MSRATCAACRSWRPRTTPDSPPERSKSLRSVPPKLGPLETSSGLVLAGDRPDHALVKIDALDLHGRHLDTPPLGLFVEHVLNVGVELVALGQHLIEVVFAEDPAQRGLRKLAGGGEIVVDLNHRALGVDDAEVD